MKNHMSNILTFVFAIVFIALFTAVFAFADGKGKMYNVYNGTSVIVDNSWEFVESEKTLYIRSNSLTAYNETGSISHDEFNSWKPYISRIEHIVLEGYFVKCSTYAFRNHTSLKDVRITENVKEIDGGAFEGCVNLESIAIGDSELVYGRADLSNVTVMRSKNAFKNTKINEIILSEGVRIEGSDHFNVGANVCIPRGSSGYDYFSSTGLYNVIDSAPVTLEIIVDGNSYIKTFDFGADISVVNVEGNCIALYSDEQCRTPYTKKYAYESVTLYGKKLLEVSEITMKLSENHGIRVIYGVDHGAIAEGYGLTLKEYGVLAMKRDGFDSELLKNTKNAHKSVIYLNGDYLASLLCAPSNGKVSFAHTAVGFEENGILSNVRSEQNIYFRGYISLYSPQENRTYTYYTDTLEFNLADISEKTVREYEKNEISLTGDELSFVKAPLEKGASPNYIYTKEELLAVLENVSLDETHYIQGQHLDSNIKSLSTFVSAAMAQAKAVPALVSFDISQLPFDAKTMNIIEECKAFIRRGGIVSFSYHMENPTGNYPGSDPCRGELGGEDKWEELMQDGTELNTKFKAILDKAYLVLNEFDREGYPVIWRPLHENNGDWFWWCAVQTFTENGVEVTRPINQETVIALWRYVYNYFEVEKGLRNLVWAYSPNVTNASSPVPTVYCYPGEEYCHIAGTDWYTAGAYEIDGKGRSYLSLVETTGKMAALTEFGPGGSLIASDDEVQSEIFSCLDQLNIIRSMIGDGMSPVYVLNWSGKCALLKLGEMKTLMNDPCVLDLDDVKDIFDTEYRKR